jgi:hypothetical protein
MSSSRQEIKPSSQLVEAFPSTVMDRHLVRNFIVVGDWLEYRDGVTSLLLVTGGGRKAEKELLKSDVVHAHLCCLSE